MTQYIVICEFSLEHCEVLRPSILYSIYTVYCIFVCVIMPHYVCFLLENVIGVQLKLSSFLDLTQPGKAEYVLQQVSHTFHTKAHFCLRERKNSDSIAYV